MTKVGRPTKYKSSMCETVVAVGEQGGTITQMAVELDISRETLNEWRKEKPDFSDAVKRGLQKAQVIWEQKGMEATFGAVEGFNATAWIFNMKNRFKDDWRDKQETEVSGGLKMVPVQADDEDI